MIEYEDASPEVRGVFDDIRATRNTDYINNFWKALASDPVTLRNTWESSAANQCRYCVASHSASGRSKGMTDEMYAELMAVIATANYTNALAAGYQVEVDERFKLQKQP